MRCFILILFTALASAQPTLRFKVPVPVSERKTDSRQAASPMEDRLGHLVIQFAQHPTDAQIAELRARGASVLQDVPDNAVLIRVDRPIDLTGLDVTYSGPIMAPQKLSPMLPPAGASRSGGMYLVEFHPDIDLNDARRLMLNAGLELRDNPDLGAHRLMVRALASPRSPDPLPRVASMDEVAYIFPASTELAEGRPVVPCSGALTENGGVGQYITTYGNGWDGPGQNAAVLSYVFGVLTDRLSSDQTRAEILRAMGEWSRVVRITWQPGASATGPRTLNILFGRGRHGDNYPFDGPGRVLAHTFYPAPPNPEPIAGDMHLDADEGWRIGANMDLYSVVLHELGHALGLGHSDNPNAVMYPYYRMVSALAAEDQTAIRTLYAAATGAPSTPTTPTTPSNPAPPTNPPPAGPTTPTNPTTPAPPPPAPPVPTPGDRTPPTLLITSPGSTSVTTSAATITFRGTASDPGGLASVTWETNLGKSGAATGTTQWTAQVPLLTGINRVTIRATDNAGNSSWRTVVVRR